MYAFEIWFGPCNVRKLKWNCSKHSWSIGNAQGIEIEWNFNTHFYQYLTLNQYRSHSNYQSLSYFLRYSFKVLISWRSIYYTTDNVVVVVVKPSPTASNRFENGGWEWWGGRLGPLGTTVKWFMIHIHKCNGPWWHESNKNLHVFNTSKEFQLNHM